MVQEFDFHILCFIALYCTVLLYAALLLETLNAKNNFSKLHFFIFSFECLHIYLKFNSNVRQSQKLIWLESAGYCVSYRHVNKMICLLDPNFYWLPIMPAFQSLNNFEKYSFLFFFKFTFTICDCFEYYYSNAFVWFHSEQMHFASFFLELLLFYCSLGGELNETRLNFVF